MVLRKWTSYGLGCDRSIDDVEEWLVMKNKMVVVVSLLLSILATMASD